MSRNESSPRFPQRANCCLYDFAVIASQCAGLPWQSPGFSAQPPSFLPSCHPERAQRVEGSTHGTKLKCERTRQIPRLAALARDDKRKNRGIATSHGFLAMTAFFRGAKQQFLCPLHPKVRRGEGIPSPRQNFVCCQIPASAFSFGARSVCSQGLPSTPKWPWAAVSP